MTEAAHAIEEGPTLLPTLRADGAEAVAAAEQVLAACRATLAARVSTGGKISNKALEADQFAAHSLSWIATYVESLRQMLGWADRLAESGDFGEIEGLILQIAFGEYLSQLRGGIPMSQGELARVLDLGITEEDVAPLSGAEVTRLIRQGNTDAARAAGRAHDGGPWRRNLRRDRARRRV